jgi:hypothetical protein
MAAEVFGEEDMQAWPAPAEPALAAAEEAAPAEEAPAVTPTAPAFAAPPPLDIAPTLEERMAPAAPALRFSGEP